MPATVHSRHASRRGRGPSSARAPSRDDEQHAQHPGPVLKSLEDRAEDEPGQRAPAGRIVGLERREDRRRRDESQHRQSAHPDRQDHERGHAEQDHPVDYGTGEVRSSNSGGGYSKLCAHYMSESSLAVLHNLATQLRIDSVRSTTAAGSGHPTTCLSAAEIVAALFFAEMRFDPHDPQHPEADRFVLSKGHAAPILYAAWAAAGAFPREDVLQLRELIVGSRRASDAAPAVRRRRDRIARAGPRRRRRHRAERAPHRLRLPHLRADGRRRIGRRLGVGSRAGRRPITTSTICARSPTSTASARAARRSGRATPKRSSSRWRAFGWHAIGIDGHDIAQVLAALDEARRTTGRPTMIVARTLKGKGVSLFEGKDDWHGKPLKKGAETDRPWPNSRRSTSRRPIRRP